MRMDLEDISAIDLVKYCGASGDFNPVHTVPKEAEQMGHPDVLVPGLMTMGWVARAMETWFPGCRMTTFQSRFLAPVYPGEKLKVVGEAGESKGHIGRCELKVINGAGDVKLKGICEFMDRKETG